MEQECAISIKACVTAIQGLPNEDILTIVDDLLHTHNQRLQDKGTERWRDVKGYKGFYQVSDQGRVRSLGRITSCYLGGPRRLKSKILRPALRGESKYLSVHLWKRGIKRTQLVHRLVLEAFVGDCPGGQVCLHGPLGALDNSVRNLSYGARSNMVSKVVVRSDGVEFATVQLAAEESRCDADHVWRCCIGRRKYAGGYSWKFKE